MENIALIAVVVLVIILALIVMLMRRNQADADVLEDEPALPSDAGDANSGMPNQSAPMTDAMDERVQSPQFGLIAKQLMAQQRYDEAEAELIRGVHSQPNNNQLKLDLLGLYAQTFNVNKFNTTYAQVQQSGDTGIISEAHHLKSLIDAETQTQHRPQSSESVQSQPTHSADDMSLDFDDGFDDATLDFDAQQPVQSQTSDAFSLEDLEADLLGSTPASNATAGLGSSSDDLTFDLDSELTATPKSTANEAPAKANADKGLDFDFGMEEELTGSPSTDATNTSDELSFDLSDENAVSDGLSLDDTTPMSSPTSVEPAVPDTVSGTDNGGDGDSDLGGLDFDLSLDSEPTSTSNPVQSADLSSSIITSTSSTASTADDDFGLDFDLDIQADTQADTAAADHGSQQANTQLNKNKNEEDLLSEDALDFDLNTDAVEAATDSTTAQVNGDGLLDDEFDFTDFGLDDDLTSADQKPKPQPQSQAQNQEQTQASQQNIAEFQDFDLDLDLSSIEGADFSNTTDVSSAQPEPKTKELSVSDLSADLQNFDNELNFDLPVEASSDTQYSNTKVEEIGVDNGLQVDFDLGELTSDTPMQTTSDDTVVRQDISMPTEPASHQQVDDNATAAFDDTYAQLDALGDDLYAFDDQTDDTVNTVSAEPKVDDTTPVRQTTSSFEHLGGGNITQPANRSDLTDLSDFDVSELDDAQITLDLAEQYIELGEYDSARRLLNEVTQSANEQYVPQAKDLLAQIS